jgi:hypothetical protein
LLLRSLRETGDPRAVINARVRRLAVPLASGGFDMVDVLSSIRYDVTAAGHPHITFEITVNPNGSWNVVHNIPDGLPGASVATSGLL